MFTTVSVSCTIGAPGSVRIPQHVPHTWAPPAAGLFSPLARTPGMREPSLLWHGKCNCKALSAAKGGLAGG
eukprot:3234183-Prymnesium_polylepis.2